MKDFYTLPLGQIFKTNHGEGKFMHYKKISKSRALVIDQEGYNNKRSVGDIQPFSAYSKVIV